MRSIFMVLTILLNSMFGQWPCYGISVHHRQQRLESIKEKLALLNT